MDNKNIADLLQLNQNLFHPVVNFDSRKDKAAKLDLSKTNLSFESSTYNDFNLFQQFIDEQHKSGKAKYLVGGYNELREMYRRSQLFGINEEPRSLHLGIDVWGPAGTKVYAPLGGMVHSFKFNNNFGDYGATIILQHQLDTINFYTLYGHLALKDIENLRVGKFITRGENFAHFGPPEENGHWPPHLHLQLIVDIGPWEGDYPGVCKLSEAGSYLINSPDPHFLLNL